MGEQLSDGTGKIISRFESLSVREGGSVSDFSAIEEVSG
jgi:hypothetical protein